MDASDWTADLLAARMGELRRVARSNSWPAELALTAQAATARLHRACSLAREYLEA